MCRREEWPTQQARQHLTAKPDKVDLTEVSEEVRRFLAAAGRKGGKSRAAKLSKTRRREIARQGGLAKAAKKFEQ